MRLPSNILLKSVLIVVFLGGSSLIGFVIYSFFLKPLPTFLTASSPDKAYTVSLKGQKTKPIFFTAEVRYDVLKNGAPLLSDEFLFSADRLKFSF